jgi:hypothetical protein
LVSGTVGKTAAGPRPHSHLGRVLSGRMTIFLSGLVNCCRPSPAKSILVSGPAVFLFFSERLLVLKWGLLFDERRGLTATDHSPSTKDSLGLVL